MSITYSESVFVAWVFQHAMRMRQLAMRMRQHAMRTRLIVVCGLSGYTIFFHVISKFYDILVQGIGHKMCFNFVYNFVRDIFKPKKNLARYNQKCILVFM